MKSVLVHLMSTFSSPEQVFGSRRQQYLLTYQKEIPTPWGKGALRNIRFDMIAGISVALVALPLSLGIALASGTPTISGLISAVVGGVLGGFFGGTQVGIKGPAAGLIVVTIGALEYFNQGMDGYRFVLAAFVVSGFLQVLLGLFRLGKIADFFPAAVVKGMLAAIGLVILAKQLDMGFLGEKGPFQDPIEIFTNLWYFIQNIHPFVAIITINSLAILIIFPRIKNPIIKMLPPPMWVMLVSIPFVFLFDFFETREISLLGREHLISTDLLIAIPDDLLKGLIFPDFSRIGEPYFWVIVFTTTLVSTIENLASAKAIEDLDPYNRKSWMNRDLVSSGGATMLAAMIGGLPVITVIVRSSVNINHGARTLWANFFHGAFVLAFIFLFGSFVEKVPLAALSAILLFTGYRLASPKVFKDSYLRGSEQFLIVVITCVCTLATGLVYGIVIGILATIVIHNLKSGMSSKLFFKYLLRPGVRLINEEKDVIVKIKGIANFFNILKIKKLVEGIEPKVHVVLEFSNARLIDYTVLEYVHKYSKEYNRKGGEMELVGLDVHQTSSNHPYAIHIHVPAKIQRLSRRQQQLKSFAHSNHWQYEPELNWNTAHLDSYHFFDTRPVEYEKNMIKGAFPSTGVDWQISDITFDEGALLATEVYHTTLMIIRLPYTIPKFTLEKEYFTDRVLELAGISDIDFDDHSKFSKSFLLQGEDKKELQEFFVDELKEFFLSKEIYHLECNGNSLMLFKYFRLGSFTNVQRMVRFAHEFTRILAKRNQA